MRGSSYLTPELHILACADNHPGVGLGGLRPSEPRALLDLEQPDAAVSAVLVAGHTVVLTNQRQVLGVLTNQRRVYYLTTVGGGQLGDLYCAAGEDLPLASLPNPVDQ